MAAFRSELRSFLQKTEIVTDEVGLTPQRYDLLLMIAWAGGTGGVRLTDLGALLHMQQPAVSELVKRAEEAKLVKRRSSPDDRRASLLRLTAEASDDCHAVTALGTIGKARDGAASSTAASSQPLADPPAAMPTYLTKRAQLFGDWQALASQ